MRTDVFTHGGISHMISQDYCYHLGSEDYDIVVVSDGCSSGKNTDIAARLLVMNTINEIHRCVDLIPENPEDILYECLSRATTISVRTLPKWFPVTFEATLGVIVRYKNTVYTYFIGDCGIAVNFKDQAMFSLWTEYKDNAPMYPMYEFDVKQRLFYYNTRGLHCQYQTHVFGDKNERSWEREDFCTPNLQIFDLSKLLYDAIYIFTDGVHNVWRNNINVTPKEVLASNIQNIKNYKGEFLQRKFGKWVRRNTDLQFRDDFTIGAIYVGDLCETVKSKDSDAGGNNTQPFELPSSGGTSGSLCNRQACVQDISRPQIFTTTEEVRRAFGTEQSEEDNNTSGVCV